eukprot:scaffold36275_cov154-Isochrysis_galbana.AAC.37
MVESSAMATALANLRQPSVLAQEGEGTGYEVGGQTVEREADSSRVEQHRCAESEGAAVARAERAASEAHPVQVKVLVRTADISHRECT